MAAIEQLRVEWTGLKGLPGVSTFYTEAAGGPALAAAVATFFEDVASLHPTGLVWTVPHSGLILDDSTGDATGNWTGAGDPDVISATHTATYAAPSGWIAEWRTGAYAGGREVRGKTFMVPLCTTFYDADGSIGGEALVQMKGAASDLAALEVMAIFSPTHHTTRGVTLGQVPDKTVVLRSRRD